MYTAEIEVTFWWHVGDVGGDSAFLAEFEDLGRGFRVVDGGQYHVYIVEVRRFEFAIDVGYLVLRYAICDFFIEAGAGADDGNFGIGVEDIEDATGGDLGRLNSTLSVEKREMKTYLTAANNENVLITNLPCEDE